MLKDKQADHGVFSAEQLAKLKETKKELQREQRQLEEEQQAKREFERKEREKNMTFAELLERHGDAGKKY